MVQYRSTRTHYVCCKLVIERKMSGRAIDDRRIISLLTNLVTPRAPSFRRMPSSGDEVGWDRGRGRGVVRRGWNTIDVFFGGEGE